MPYIEREARAKLDPEIDALIAKLREAPLEKLDGQLSYVIFRLLVNLYPPKYFNYSRAMGVLASIMHEFYRRYVAPYEDEKLRSNGDVS